MESMDDFIDLNSSFPVYCSPMGDFSVFYMYFRKPQYMYIFKKISLSNIYIYIYIYIYKGEKLLILSNCCRNQDITFHHFFNII